MNDYWIKYVSSLCKFIYFCQQNYRKMKKQFEDFKDIIRSRKSKGKQYRDQKTISNSKHAAQKTIY